MSVTGDGETAVETRALSGRMADRGDPEEARRILERLVPDETLRRALLSMLVGSLEAAHAASPQSWGLTLERSGRFLRLNVGRVLVFDINEADATLVIEQSALNVAGVDEVGVGPRKEAHGRSAGFLRALPGTAWLRLSHDSLRSRWPELREAHLSAVRRAAEHGPHTPFGRAHSPGALAYLRAAFSKDLPSPGHTPAGEAPLGEFLELFEECAREYFTTPPGREHLARYDTLRAEGRRNLDEVVTAAARGDDVTDAVLLKLFPYAETAANREKGAWIHVAPAVAGDLRGWFEGVGWVRRQDWPAVAAHVLEFLRRCAAQPDELREACAAFAASPLGKGFQTGLLSPILNALHPDQYLLITAKPRRVINWVEQSALSQGIGEYPALNEAGWRVIELLADLLPRWGMDTRPADAFDAFSHWLVAIKRFGFGQPEKKQYTVPRYWKVAPGEAAWQWEACRKEGFIGIGWSELGDVSSLTREEFEARREQLVAQFGWKKAGVDQVWVFAQIHPGDRIVANRGTAEVLGIGTVAGPYQFVPGERHAHRLPVQWDDVSPRRVQEGGWRKTLVQLTPEKFEAILGAPLEESPPDQPVTTAGFLARAFDLLAALHREPTRAFYQAHREAFVQDLEGPFQELVRGVVARLPQEVRARLETEQGIFGRVLKNDWGRGGAWDFYWAAFFPRGGKRIRDAQLFVWLNHERLEYGFGFGEYSGEQVQRFLRNIRAHRGGVGDALARVLEGEDLWFGRRELTEAQQAGRAERVRVAQWLDTLEEVGPRAVVIRPREEVLAQSQEGLAEAITGTFRRLFPLMLLTTHDEPLPAILEYVGEPDAELPAEAPRQPPYSLAECAEETGLDEERLRQWVQAIERKGQAILYGPPGTGKTFVAEHLARHLVAGGTGFWDLMQFHPAYAYEDFVQGIRPRATPAGQLTYETTAGRFVEFCERARRHKDTCVLIVDEINRANLARVFGELMYLLEYRDRDIPLPGGGRLEVPQNVRILGTMNTADRSIALVDHALRRRFAFLRLQPDYDVLRRYHERRATGFGVEGLIGVLRAVNREIDDPDYAVGISFFLRDDLEDHLADIWRMEIEPYLEEYFFDRRDRLEALRWDRVRERLMGSA